MKIYIFGKKGNGKTKLANRILKDYDISILHLDKLKPWEDKGKYFDSLREHLKHDSWIIEGAWGEEYGAKEIAKDADILIWLDLDAETNYNNRLKREIERTGGDMKQWDMYDRRWRQAILTSSYNKDFHKSLWENHKGPKMKFGVQWEWSDIKKFLNKDHE